MKLSICLLLFCGSLYAATTTQRTEDSEAIRTTPVAPTVEGISGTVLEKLLSRFDQLERELLEIKNELSQHREEVERNRLSHENTLHRLEQNVARNISFIVEQQKSCANHSSYEVVEQALLSFKSRTPDCVTPTTSTETDALIYASCKDAPTNVSGVYLIRENNVNSPFKVYCEMEKFEGGWLVVQHRFDGSVDFYQNWDQYRDGFGELGSEFWVGLERIHQLTTARNYELIVEVKDFTGNYGYARYNAFQIGSESEQYSLKTVGSYSGTAGDSLSISRGHKFSTKDRKDASSGIHYAVSYKGAWWHNGGFANLNGRYKHDADGTANWWYTLKTDARGLRFTRMMMREL
ncbi:fibrinogen-like protein A [Anopheles albimanus]|uniref:Fibrinogen C-terminal domain-containing protein n=1 Tax=Anopheles albimanus TaxID=7167 RepID=A0A8W7K7S4_ANOAL|nr:fibrinogen-like protein A [Anopheles albimanus]